MEKGQPENPLPRESPATGQDDLLTGIRWDSQAWSCHPLWPPVSPSVKWAVLEDLDHLS